VSGVGSTRDLLPVAAVEESALRLTDGGLRAVLECPTLAFGIKGEAEQRAVVDGWAALLNSLQHPIQVLVRTRALETWPAPTAIAGCDNGLGELRDSYAGLMAQLTSSRRLVSRRFFVVVPWNPSSLPSGARRLFRPRAGGGTRIADDGLAVLDQRVAWVSECLRRIDLEPIRLAAPALTPLFLQMLCPETASTQPVQPDEPLDDWSGLVAPAAVEERPFDIQIGTRLARVLGISRYPTRLHPGWLGSLQAFEGDVDVSLHVRPSPSQTVMSFLERRVAELSSTVRLAEEAGRRADPFRRAALEDVEELQDRLARGEERLFEASLYLAIWADDESALDASTQRLEGLLGARMLHSRRLLFQMEPGLISALPLGLDRVGLRRSLSTTALAATFPFTGNDLAENRGLLYGINPGTRSPVVLDRFTLENHNAVVFATSGAGKSYLVKVELMRARLAGIRAQVIDPEGEYASIVEAMGGAVVAVRPGAPVGLEPFAIPDGEAGSLTTRVSSLLTLVDLLGGGLSANQRAAAEDAISFAYATRGFADDGQHHGLTPPVLADVQVRLRHRAEAAGGTLREDLGALAIRLERYVSGAGRWLFAGGGSVPDAPLVAFLLDGLPEEDRAPAMFMVLDHLWRGLGQTSERTLVVLDEAWWLMQYPDTARFLFRLAKTARKRRAGLTLVTQDVTDVLESPLGEPVITNSALQVLMKQAPQAIPRLADLFRLTPAEQSWLLNARPGEGLLLAAGKRVPFEVVASEAEARLIRQAEQRRVA
jgi:TraG P-loop domain/Helicase HerA, central domain